MYLIGFDVNCPICNKKHNVKITKEQVGEILQVAKQDYLEWIIQKWKLTEEYFKNNKSVEIGENL